MAAIYAIRVKGHLGAHWAQWFDGLTITNDANGEGVLSGPLADQGALFGVLARVRDLGLTLIEVRCLEDEGASREGGYAAQ
ncbi:MAG: hypothetical protein H7Y32_13060 [Chloroflexales bacterium]|nr:hypothetical protein [Chloroflexales bacterium]